MAGPPPTGDAAIDEAVLGLGELAATPLADHHDRLAQVHEVLSAALDPADPAGPSPLSVVPGGAWTVSWWSGDWRGPAPRPRP